MKSKKHSISLFYSVLLIFVLQNCERDDICAEATLTTPQLSIEFNDFSNPDVLKVVPQMTLYAQELLTEDPVNASEATLVFNTNSNAATLPLKINDEGINTTFQYVIEKDTNLRLDDDNTETSNKDIIEIQYTSEFEYVSRACGYKSIFNLINVTVIPDDDNWINTAEIIIETVENENSVHVRIFH